MKHAATTLLGFIEKRIPALLRAVSVSFLLLLFSSQQSRSDNCKPDVSRVDKISKQQNDIWTQKVGGTGFGASLMGSTDMALFVTVGRYGNANAVNVEILKEEASAASASFDSSLRAVKGNRFFLGFKAGGDPLGFVATDVANSTKVRNDVLDFGNGKVVTSIILSSIVSDDDIATMRDALTTKSIDAIRVLLAGDLRVEYSLNEKTGAKLMEKFQCFFAAMDKRGFSRPAPAIDDAGVALVRGKYVRKGGTDDALELKPDGRFSLLLFMGGKKGTASGYYTVQGDTLTLTNPRAAPSQAQISGGTLKFTDGNVWEKETEAPKQAQAPKIDETVTLRLGMTPEQVEAAQGGKPQKVIDLGSKKTYIYPDMKIIFTNGKVSDIQ